MSASLKPRDYFDDVAREAIRLATHGLAVFPVKDKKPTTPYRPGNKGGFYFATKDPNEIADLWHRYPGPLIGVRTGITSGIDVVDVDLYKEVIVAGEMTKPADDWFSDNAARLPRTRVQQSPRGGLHLLFRHRQGMRSSASVIAPFVDVRSEGGYITWYPSAGYPILDTSRAAEWPAWLAEAALPPPPPKIDLARIQDGLRNADRYVQAAVRSAVSVMAACPEGTRNQTLNAETYALGRFIADGHLTAGQIAEAMAAAGLQAGLTKPEIEKTITSALRARMGG